MKRCRSSGLVPTKSAINSVVAAWEPSTRGSTSKRASRRPSNSSPTRLAHEPDFRHRFEAEIETLRKLNHPHIVRLFGFGEQDEHLFYAMELVAGSSLEEELSRGRAFSWREVLRIGIDLARALRHAHDRGVVHRDIKPSNLLLTADEEVKLSDFGIARLFGSMRHTMAGSVLGTAEFMSPEQADGRPVEPAVRPLQPGRGALRAVDAAAVVPRQVGPRNPLEAADRAADARGRVGRPTCPANCSRSSCNFWRRTPSSGFPTAAALLRRLEALDRGLPAAGRGRRERQ